MKKYRLYRILRPLTKIFMKVFFRIQIIGEKNIPKKGRVILSGNHTSYLDPLLIMSCSKRTLRFLAKKELHDHFYGFFFKSMATIPVDRYGDTSRAKKESIEALNMDDAIVVFPEGTINKSKDVIMPFKKGAVSFASKTNSKIVPFTIKGKYKLFRKSVTIKFLKPITISDDIIKENEKLMNIIKEELLKWNQ